MVFLATIPFSTTFQMMNEGEGYKFSTMIKKAAVWHEQFFPLKKGFFQEPLLSFYYMALQTIGKKSWCYSKILKKYF